MTPSNTLPVRLCAMACAVLLAATATVHAEDPEPAEAQAAPLHYPVLTAPPVARAYAPKVRGLGTVRADARAARSVTAATVVLVSEVLVLPGASVSAGQPLLRVEADPQAYLGYRQALSAQALAAHEVERLTTERADNLATASQLETAEKALSDARAAVEAARRQGAGVGDSVIRAPLAGVVNAIAVAAGDRPAPGSVLMSVTPPVTRVTLGIEPEHRGLVRVGDRVRLTTIPADGGPRTGRVATVGAALDPESRLVPVSVALDPASGPALLVGVALEGVIETRSVPAFSVPRAALVRDDSGVGVFEIAGGKAHRVAVAIVGDEGARVSVTGNLDATRPLATLGAYELEDGVAVEVRRP